VIYVPPGEDFFCVEPVSHANDGFNLMARGIEGTGVQVLEPGQTLAGNVTFRLD
jgi:aldose 1-epimerase